VRDGYGLDTQEQQGRERCNNHTPPIEVVRVFREEGVSGNKSNRPVFEEVIQFLKEKNEKYSQITHFVCRDLSRISRPDLNNIGMALEMENRIKQYGVEIVDITGGIKDDTDEGQLMKNIQYLFAGYDRKMIMKKCRNGIRARLMDGYRAFGEVPMGYIRRKI
jgi:DNA invertase Pin-like site-specific DNA recombinase